MVVTAFTAVLVLVFVGFCPSQATRCTRENLQNCKKMAGVTGCKLSQDVRDCLETMEKNCTDDSLEVEVVDNLNWARLEGDQCQGLPKGECFHSAWLNCEKKIPTFDKEAESAMDKDEKKVYCDDYEKKMNSFKTCLDDLKSKCTSEGASRRVGLYQDWAVNNLKNCQLY